MEIIIGSTIIMIPTHSAFAFVWWFFKTIGWIIPVFLFVWGLILGWQLYIRNEYRKKRKYMLLAIDIPKGNEQTPKAIENMFAHLSGAHQPLKFHHNWWEGEIPESFSFEIISIGGYIQFIIHFEVRYRDLIEAIVYAQYPDAEITEIEDYTRRWANIKMPHEKYDTFGSEVKLTNKQWYPIITHREFEDSISQELKDPLASTLEGLTRIGPGEEIWLQYLVTPANNDWGKPAQAEVNKIIKAKNTGGKTIADKIFEAVGFIADSLNPASVDINIGGHADPPNQMLYLTEVEKESVKSIQHKVSRPGFHTKIRYMYIAEKDKYNKLKAFNNIYGSLKQYNSLGLNGFKNDLRYFTGAIVWFKKRRLIWRKNRMMWRYVNRGQWLSPGEYGPILISEELASLWHFPSLLIKAPLVKKTEAKKAEPPITLPVEEAEPPTPSEETPKTKSGPPVDLPT